MGVRLGISVYPDIQPFEEIEAYIRLASGYGFGSIFSSMFSVEGTNEEVRDYFVRLIDTAHKYHMSVSLDVNPQCFERFGADYNDISVFADMHVDILRMDMNFGAEKDSILINNPYGIRIMFNATGIQPSYVDDLRKNNADFSRLVSGHNFYPQRYTALKMKTFTDTNRFLKKEGIHVQAFVASQAENTCGVWDAKDGLPTVEMMRDMPIDTQARIMLATGDVDEIMIGNACAFEEELKALSETVRMTEVDDNSPLIQMLLQFGAKKEMFEKQKKLKVSVSRDISDTERKILFDYFPHFDAGDSSEWIWRSRFPRITHPDIPFRKAEGDLLPVGSVLIVNNNYRHYAGEIQIALRPLKNDGQRNVIGTVEAEEMEVLKYIQDRDVVVFVE